MADSQSIASDAFHWLDRHMIESADTPDEAFDWVYVIHNQDWPLFEDVWKRRPDEWREAFVYLLCNGPVRESQRILRLGLFDSNLKVSAEAACTICRHFEIEPECVVLDSAVIERLKNVFEENKGRHMEQVSLVLAQLN
jgi:hypothetical protein